MTGARKARTRATQSRLVEPPSQWWCETQVLISIGIRPTRQDLFWQQLTNDWLAHLSSDGGSSEDAAYFVWKIVKVRLGKCANHFSSSLRLFLLKYSHSQFIFYYSTTEELTMEWAHHRTGRQLRYSRYASWKCFNNMTKFLKSRNWLESQNFLWIGQLKLLFQRDLFYYLHKSKHLTICKSTNIFWYWRNMRQSCVV